MMLEDHRIRLRALEPEDVTLLLRWENDASCWRTGNTLAPYSRYVLRQYLEQSTEDIYTTRQLKLVIEWKVTGEAVGVVDLFNFDPHHRRMEIGCLVDASWRGQGISSAAVQLASDYALEFLHLHQIYSLVEIQNTASRGMLLSAGFAQSGVLSDWLLTEEGYQDVLVLQKLSLL